MFIRQYFKQENGQRTAYWALVEPHRTATGPRQRVVAWPGKLDEAGRRDGIEGHVRHPFIRGRVTSGSVDAAVLLIAGTALALP